MNRTSSRANQSVEPTGGSRYARDVVLSPRRLPPVAHADRRNMSYKPMLWSDRDGDCGCWTYKWEHDGMGRGNVPDSYQPKQCPCQTPDLEKRRLAEHLFELFEIRL